MMMLVLLVLACAASLGSAQGPWHGVSKTTLAAETDPLGAMAFVQKYFGTTPDSDSCDGNVCLCNAGDSGATGPWEAVLGRSDIVKAAYPAGTCKLVTAMDAIVGSETTHTAVVKDPSPGVDCAYTDASAVAASPTNEGYDVSAHDADTCCKSCAALSTCVAATFIPVDNSTTTQGRRLVGAPPDYEGFGLHLPAIEAHLTTGGLSVKEVESHFADKMGAMAGFDSFMDYNAGLYTTELDSYLSRFEADGVPYLGAKWPTPAGDLMFSVFVLVPTSQMVIELMASTSPNYFEAEHTPRVTVLF